MWKVLGLDRSVLSLMSNEYSRKGSSDMEWCTFHFLPPKQFTLTINAPFDLSIVENMSVMKEPVAFLIFTGGHSLG